MDLEREIIEHGFAGSQARLQIVLSFLQQQGVDEVCELAGVQCISSWQGADKLSEDELSFLQRLAFWQSQYFGCGTAPKKARVEQAPPPAEFQEVQELQQLASKTAAHGTGATPGICINLLGDRLVDEASRMKWVEEARIQAIIGSCRGSLKSVKSGIRCFLGFAEKVLGRSSKRLPPSVDDILAWSMCFRCQGTFSNYLGYLRVGCMLAQVSTDAFNDPAVKRAKSAIKARRRFHAREKMFVRHDMIQQIMKAAAVLADAGTEDCEPTYALLYLVTFVFLLRLPSEVSPCIVHSSMVPCAPASLRPCPLPAGAVGLQAMSMVKKHGYTWKVWQCISVLHICCASYSVDPDNTLCLQLKSRKNKPEGSILKRECWCKGGVHSMTCPIHVIWPQFERLAIGTKPFAGITPAKALKTLRWFLHCLNIEGAALYRCHDIRRGHADDLWRSGASLAKILHWGEWSSPSYLKYMDLRDLEASAVVEAHVQDSSSEEEEEIDG